MTAARKLVSTIGLSREDWLRYRRLGIGGSDVAAITGHSPWTTPLELYLDKKGLLPEKEQLERMTWGNVLEEPIAKEWAKRNDVRIRRRKAMLYRSDKPWMLGNLDFEVVGERAGLEIKNIGLPSRKEWGQFSHEVPAHYELQVQHYMAVTGMDRWYVAALCGGQELIEREIKRDQSLIDEIERLEEVFWREFVEANKQPDGDLGALSSDVLLALYPHGNGSMIELPDDYITLLNKRDELSEQEKKVKSEKDAIENKIKAAIGENDGARIGNRIVMWTRFEQSRIDSKTLRKEQPAIAQKYTSVNMSQRMNWGKAE